MMGQPTMHLPGFTSEALLYSTKNLDNFISFDFGVSASNPPVVPAYLTGAETQTARSGRPDSVARAEAIAVGPPSPQYSRGGRLPGFDAASSLYKTSGHYRMAVAGQNTSGNVGLRPLAGLLPRAAGTSPPELYLGKCDVECYCGDGGCLRDCEICVPCPKGVLPNGCGGCVVHTVACGAEPECPPGYVASCGTCCPSGLVACSCAGSCIDPSNDPDNCGGCGNVCPTGQVCMEGQCVCASGGVFCNETCCAAGQSCFNGCCATNAAGMSLIGFSNYLLFDCADWPDCAGSCQFIRDLGVSLVVEEDLGATVMPLGGGSPIPDGGFTLQLNAFNPSGEATDWMQYGILVQNNAISATIQYWNMTAFNSCTGAAPKIAQY